MTTIEKRTLKGTVLGFISFGINVVHSIVLVPFFLTFWGEVKYGQFIGIYAFIQLMRTLDAGHQVFVGNQFNLYYHVDKTKAYETLSSSMIIAFIIGGIEFIIFCIIWFFGWGDKVLGLEARIDHGLFLGIGSMLVMWWLVGSIGGILVKAIIAKGLFSEATMFAILIKVIEIILIGLAIGIKASLAKLFMILALSNFIFSVIVLYWVYVRMPEYFPWWKDWSLKTGIRNLGKSIVLTINGLMEQLNSNGLILLVSQYLSIVLVPVFSTIRTLSNTMNMMTNIIIQPLAPEMIRLHSQGKKIKIVRVIQATWFFSGLIVNLGFIILLPVAGSLYSLWTNHKLQFNELFFYMMVLSVVMFNYGRSLTSYLSGINDLKALSVITWVKSIVLFGVSLIWIRLYGLIAVGLGVVLSELLGSVLLPNYYLQHHLRKELKEERFLIVYAAPIVIMFIIIISLYYMPDDKFIIAGLGFVAILIVYYQQWKILDLEIKEKLWGLTRNYKRKFLRH